MSTITTRAGKGGPLTHAEMDANLNNLNTNKLEVSDLASTASGKGVALVGNAVSLTGTETLTNKTLTAPNIGAATGASLVLSGAASGASLIPTGAAIPANGLYLPAANEVAFATNATKRLTLTSDGRLYGSALHNNAGSVTGTTNQYIASGTYLPTITEVLNVSIAGGYTSQWMRVGNVVTVSGALDLDPILASTETEVGISLPIPTVLGFAFRLSGSGHRGNVAGHLKAEVFGDAVANRARLTFLNDADIALRDWYFTFTYLVI